MRDAGRRHRSRFRGQVVVAAAALLAACAQLQDGPTSEPEPEGFVHAAHVRVARFQNQSGTAGFQWGGESRSVADAVREQLVAALGESQAFQVVDSAADADLLVGGTVIRFRSGSAAGPDQIALDLRVVERQSGRALAKATVTGSDENLSKVSSGPTSRRLQARNGGFQTSIEKTVRAAAIRGVDFIAGVARDSGHLEPGAREPSQSQAGPAAPLPPPDPTLRRAQTKLNALGYGCGDADGRMGPRTASCLRSYQEEMGLDPTGTLDDSTASQLAL